MPRDTLVSLRLDPRLKSAVLRQARCDDLSFSDVVRILLKAYAKRTVKISVHTRQKRKIPR
ncbi:hypothetical protein FJZ28_03315 [Candidatus Peregrinibacteria bacterium]|nr:hypothetical protein [Candidatus Peregrinibacteria bacterium]